MVPVTRALPAVCLAAVLGGCGAAAGDGSGQANVAITDTAVVDEAFVTPFDTLDNVDSPAVFHSGDTHWLLASAKTTDVVLVFDATTGTAVRRVGTSGSGPGQLRRPNGLAVIDSLLFVVERDNDRVQVFSIPDFRSAGLFGQQELLNPYGITVHATAAGRYSVYVTDNYETDDEGIPPDAELGARVKQYEVTNIGGRLTSRLVRVFGDTTNAGALRTVESILVDPPLDRLLIAEETVVDSHIKVYDLEGRFTGRIVGRGLFPQQAEGIALWSCPDTSGYVIATDQGEGTNTFHVLDRRTLEHVASWTGRRTRLTDGIALTQAGFGPFVSGALYASHLDGAVTAQDWEEIANALGLRTRCST